MWYTVQILSDFQEKLLDHLRVVLYEYLRVEYPEVLGSILGGLKLNLQACAPLHLLFPPFFYRVLSWTFHSWAENFPLPFPSFLLPLNSPILPSFLPFTSVRNTACGKMLSTMLYMWQDVEYNVNTGCLTTPAVILSLSLSSSLHRKKNGYFDWLLLFELHMGEHMTYMNTANSHGIRKLYWNHIPGITIPYSYVTKQLP